MNQDQDRKCDLHIHSTYSDSDATIIDIFEQAKKHEISCISITDHDTVAGLIKAREASRQFDIELVDGIEISAQKDDIEVHILGFFIDLHSALLGQKLTFVQEMRRERILLMAGKLNALGLTVDTAELFSLIDGGVPTRLHLALYMVRRGYVKHMVEAFKKYLSPGKPAYVSRFKYTVQEAIALIKDAGGLSFIAHPYSLPEQSWIDEFAGYGIDGIEVMYPRLSKEKIAVYESTAARYKLLKSGGSDAHGTYKHHTQIGGTTIPYGWVVEMKERIACRADPKPLL